jgi:glycine/D-amino acid oxidase-like deaminating enzyme
VVRQWPQLASVAIEAALLVPRDGVIEIRGLLKAYAEGLEIQFGRSVKRLEPGRVVLEDEPIAARCVVDASGAWAGAMTNDPPLDVFKRHLFTVEGTVSIDLPYVWHLGAQELYVRPDREGVLACACDAELTAPCEQTPSADADARLAARLDARVKTRWACQRAFAADRKMRIGRDPARPWLVWAAALGGHGATASAAVGERAAAAVMEVLDG